MVSGPWLVLLYLGIAWLLLSPILLLGVAVRRSPLLMHFNGAAVATYLWFVIVAAALLFSDVATATVFGVIGLVCNLFVWHKVLTNRPDK